MVPIIFPHKFCHFFNKKEKKWFFFSSANLITSFVICWEKFAKSLKSKNWKKRKEKPDVKFGKF
jgi:hypothetical protein